MCQRIHVTFTTKVGVSFMDHMTFWKLTCFFVPCKLHAIQHNGPTSQVVCECLLATEFSSQVLELLYPAIQILLVCWMITELASPLQYGCQLLLMIAVGKAPEVASTHSNGNLEAWMLVRLWSSLTLCGQMSSSHFCPRSITTHTPTQLHSLVPEHGVPDQLVPVFSHLCFSCLVALETTFSDSDSSVDVAITELTNQMLILSQPFYLVLSVFMLGVRSMLRRALW